MPKRVIITDTSSLIALKNIDELEILHKIYNKITITKEVADEYGEILPDWVNIEIVKDQEKVALLELELDKGEASAIALSLEQKGALLIIDERKGRAIAKKIGLEVTGILGVILKAKEKQILSSVKPILEKLEKIDFRMSNSLKLQVLKKAGE